MKTTTTLSAALFAVSTLATTSTASADEVTLRAVSAFTLGTAFTFTEGALAFAFPSAVTFAFAFAVFAFAFTPK